MHRQILCTFLWSNIIILVPKRKGRKENTVLLSYRTNRCIEWMNEWIVAPWIPISNGIWVVYFGSVTLWAFGEQIMGSGKHLQSALARSSVTWPADVIVSPASGRAASFLTLTCTRQIYVICQWMWPGSFLLLGSFILSFDFLCPFALLFFDYYLFLLFFCMYLFICFLSFLCFFYYLSLFLSLSLSLSILYTVYYI